MDSESVQRRGAKPNQSAKSLTASTESETFESWTVVSGATKKNLEVPVDQEGAEKGPAEAERPLDEEDESRGIEIIEKEDNNKRGNESTDDLSDGISIISDSESAGRTSPCPLLGKVPETILNESEDSAKEDASYDPLTPPMTPSREAEECTKIITFVERSTGMPQSDEGLQQKENRSLFRVRAIFVVSCMVVILAFFAKTNFWGSEQAPTDAAPLLQKLNEFELQNNLLRAEIDILNRHINYLNAKHQEDGAGRDEKVPYRKFEKYEKKPEKAKWAGDGDMLIEPLEPYEKPPGPPHDAEKRDKPSEAPPVPPGQHPHFDRKPGREEYQKYPDKHKYPPKDGKYDPKHDQKFNQKYEQKYDSKYDPKYQKRDNGKVYKNEDYKKGKDKYYKDENEKFRSPDGRKDHNRGEGFREKHDYKKNEDDWHEKMMQQREELRRKQETHDSKNWYIERGNGRQEVRGHRTEGR